MRLAYVVGTYPQPSETFIAREAAGLRARGRQVEIFSLFAPEGGPAADVHYGWATAAARARRRWWPGPAQRALARRWQQRFAALQCQAVVAHFGSLPSSVALDAAGALPFFLSLHARDLYVEAERLPEKLARARAVVTCTQANVEYLRAHFPAQAEQIHLIYHGLPASWLDAPMPTRSRLPGEPLRLLAIGRFVEKKGFTYLLDACARLRAEGILLRVTLIGDGPLAGALQAQCARLGLRDAVAFPGWTDEAGVRAALAEADLLCCPSVIAADGDRDGLPNVVVEAMAAGLPVVASRVSALPEAVQDGVTGYLVPPADPAALAAALARCAAPAARARLGGHAAAHARRHFRAEQWLDRLEAILQTG